MRHILPRHQKFLDLAAAHNLPVMMHTCGSSSWAYEDYIRLGLKAVDTLQPEAADMSPAHLKKTFGGHNENGCAPAIRRMERPRLRGRLTPEAAPTLQACVRLPTPRPVWRRGCR